MTYVSQQAPAAPAQNAQAEVPKKTVVFSGGVTRVPELRTTANGSVVTNVDFAITTEKGPVYAQATFWGSDAYLVSDFITKAGDTIIGVGLQYMHHYQKNDGTQGSQLKYDSSSLLLTTSQSTGLINALIDAKLAAPATPVETQTTTPVAPVVNEPAPVLDITSDTLPF